MIRTTLFAAAVALAAPASAQNADGGTMVRPDTNADRTDVAGTTQRRDTTVVGPHSPAPAGAMDPTSTPAQNATTPPPTTGQVATEVAPPAAVVAPVAPGVAAVVPLPGIAVTSKAQVQDFGAFDVDDNGSLGRMEFAQLVQFLSSAPASGGAGNLPERDRTVHAGAPKPMRPGQAVSLLNQTAAAFSAVDADHDGSVSRAELAAAALM